MPEKPDPKAAEKRLKAARDRALRKKLGQPLPLSDTALDQAAEVRVVDVESAVAFWNRVAPAEAKGLLEATSYEVELG